MLVADGARDWAREHSVGGVCEEGELAEFNTTDATRRQWKKYNAMLNPESVVVTADANNEHESLKRSRYKGGDVVPPEPAVCDEGTDGYDSEGTKAEVCAKLPKRDASDIPQHSTVGAVACDAHGNVAAGTSSGGVWCKTSGRVGPAAQMGCGCFASKASDTRPATACSVSGTGEDLMESMFALRCNQELASRCSADGLRPLLTEFSATGSEAGVIAIQASRDDECSGDDENESSEIRAGRSEDKVRGPGIEVTWAHSTEHMAVAFLCVKDQHSMLSPKVNLSVYNFPA
jgi:hypothetical protein